MSIFDDIGHAFSRAGEAVSGAAATVGGAVVTAGETVGGVVVIAGQTAGNLVTRPGEVFADVPYRDHVETTRARSAVPDGDGALQGLDVVVSVGEAAVNRMLSGMWASGKLTAFHGAVKLAGADASGFALEGTWGCPSLDFDYPGQSGLARLLVRIENGTLGHYQGWGADARLVGTAFGEMVLAFAVKLDMPALRSDAVGALPEPVRQALAGRADFQLQRLVVDFQSAALASLDPRRCTLDGKPLEKTQLASAQALLENYFTTLPPDQGVLGYAVTQPDAPGGGGELRPNQASFSTTADPAGSTLNYLFTTGARTFAGTAPGNFPRVLLPAGWPAVMVVDRRRFVGDLIEGRLLGAVSAVLGIDFAYQGNRAWTLDSSERYSGRVVQRGSPNDLYGDGEVEEHVRVALSAPGGRSVVVTAVGNGSWAQTLWIRPLGNRGELGSVQVTTSWSLSVTLSIGPAGDFQVAVQPASVAQRVQTHSGNVGQIAAFSELTQRLLDAVADRGRKLQALPLQNLGQAISRQLSGPVADLLLPGGDTFAFEGVGVDDELNLLVRLAYR